MGINLQPIHSHEPDGLTQAILIGTFIAGAVFLNKIASIDIDVQGVDADKLRQRGIEAIHRLQDRLHGGVLNPEGRNRLKTPKG